MKRHSTCNSCGYEVLSDEPLYDCPECESTNIKRRVVVECCGTDLYCPNFTNTCPECGSDYNSSGQLLASREQWGIETHESLDEIMDIDNCSTDELLDPETTVSFRVIEDS